MTRPLCFLLLLGLGLTQPAPERVSAQAATSSSRSKTSRTQRARELFNRGIDLAQEQRWAEARAAFSQARAVQERASIVYNLALSQYHLNELSAAQKTLDDLNRIAKPGSVHHREGKRLRPLVERDLARLLLHLAPSLAAVVVDGHHVPGKGPTRELRLDPGHHQLAVRATGYAPHELELKLERGEQLTKRILLEPLGTNSSSNSQLASNGDESSNSSGSKSWVLVAAGATLGLIALGVLAAQ